MTDNSVPNGAVSTYMIHHEVYIPNPYSEPSLIESAIPQNFYTCYQCKINFDTLKNFEAHNAVTHSSRKKCELCPATFRRQDHLKRHVQSIHTNHKYYRCPVCEKDCSRQDILLKHIKRKHSDQPAVFKCRNCKEYQCNSLSELEKHESSHTSTDRHVCQICSTIFKRRDHMLRHIKSQHSNQSIVCPVCNQTYKRTDHLTRHVREKHKMGLLNGKLVKSQDLIGPD